MYKISPGKELILGSASPRRKRMLAGIGLEFTVKPIDIEEEINPRRSLAQEAQRLAILKAMAFGDMKPGQVLLTADTLVGINGRILGKPESTRQAEQMIAMLAGNTHQVATGFCLQGLEHDGDNWMESGYQLTQVTFRALSAAEIKAYVASNESMDKAGAYGIQKKGASLVESINGSFHNVVGLPLAKVLEKLLIYKVIEPGSIS